MAETPAQEDARRHRDDDVQDRAKDLEATSRRPKGRRTMESATPATAREFRAANELLLRLLRDESSDDEIPFMCECVRMTFPELHLADWRPAKDTVNLYCQIVGKVRLATTPPRNHWWNAPLYVDVRGLTTRRMHFNDTTFEIDLDFVDHALLVRTHDGRTRSF